MGENARYPPTGVADKRGEGGVRDGGKEEKGRSGWRSGWKMEKFTQCLGANGYVYSDYKYHVYSSGSRGSVSPFFVCLAFFFWRQISVDF